jgi:hypothetical protein
MHKLMPVSSIYEEIFVYTSSVISQTDLFFSSGSTVKVCLSGISSTGKVALAAYFHRAHYNTHYSLQLAHGFGGIFFPTSGIAWHLQISPEGFRDFHWRRCAHIPADSATTLIFQ